jgi:hypothetical protein
MLRWRRPAGTTSGTGTNAAYVAVVVQRVTDVTCN